MTTIVLAHWYDGRPPGSELDVDADQLRHLRRDGRVSAVVEQMPAEPAPAPVEAVPLGEPAAEEPEAVSLEETLPAKGRRRR
ncbi:hypothetical protein [Streptomyces sp. PAM3C]|uniref:hypothetical protein n=1 Tax=Streptomyces sp. PAM3C TaxID=2847300 RepID=UPI001C1E68A9|nr:hypothetical protein [Streptomyces sp. PAM3C]MBU5946809.1 hypothetical protein [Streptomyces sp. PAM3C]